MIKILRDFRDPKAEYHIYWIAPLFVLGAAIGMPIYYARQALDRLKAFRQHQKWKKDPEISRMRELTGIEKDK